MIERVKVTNFQSHEDTDVKFQSGLNVITGETDSGKSALFNALVWAITNRPMGVNRLKNWDAGIGEQIEVSVEFDDGKIKHKRSATKNTYIINETDVLNAIRSDVPTEVESVTRMSDINFQGQHSLYFLLQQSAGQVSGSFNDVTGLAIIDEVRTEIKGTIDNLKDELITLNSNITEMETQLEFYGDIDDASEKLDELEILYKKIDRLIKTKTRILEILDSIESINNELQQHDTYLQAMPLIELCERIQSEYLIKIDVRRRLNLLLTDIETQNNNLRLSDTQLVVLPMLDSLNQIRDKIDTLSGKLNSIQRFVSSIQTEQLRLTQIEYEESEIMQEIHDLIAANPNCPICQAPIHSDDIPRIVECL